MFFVKQSAAMPEVDRMLEEWPPAPPNTEVVGNCGSPCDSVWSFRSSMLDDDNSDLPLKLRGKTAFKAANVLANIEEEKPGEFYESDTDVPNNTPYGTEDSLTPRSNPINSLAKILEDFEPLPESILPVTHFTTKSTACSDTMADTVSATETTSSASDALYMADTKRGRSKVTVSPEKREGIMEFSNWAPDVEADLKHALLRLANLALDEHLARPECPVEHYYKHRLSRIINDKDLAYAYGELGDIPLPDPAAVPTYARPQSHPASYITRSEFQNVERRVGVAEKRIGLAVDKSFGAASGIERLKAKSQTKLAEHDANLQGLKDKAHAIESNIIALKKCLFKDDSSETLIDAGAGVPSNED